MTFEFLTKKNFRKKYKRLKLTNEASEWPALFQRTAKTSLFSAARWNQAPLKPMTRFLTAIFSLYTVSGWYALTAFNHKKSVSCEAFIFSMTHNQICKHRFLWLSFEVWHRWSFWRFITVFFFITWCNLFSAFNFLSVFQKDCSDIPSMSFPINTLDSSAVTNLRQIEKSASKICFFLIYPTTLVNEKSE